MGKQLPHRAPRERGDERRENGERRSRKHKIVRRAICDSRSWARLLVRPGSPQVRCPGHPRGH
eukprot:1696927-Pyramimonas_sp.AAC.1